MALYLSRYEKTLRQAWQGEAGWDWAGFSGWEKVESDTRPALLPRELSGGTPQGGYSFIWVLLSLPLLRDV